MSCIARSSLAPWITIELARDERADLAAFLATLTPAQWQAASLCAGWTVKDVVAHIVSYDELSAGGLLRRFVKGRIAHANHWDVFGTSARWIRDGTISLH